ncbi:tyrosine-type recombinase/integrase [Enterococcus innesii]|uniref:tyrosine-type recombinase/integrase n=1 Tax=Enterococcus TaxID=1350 RepID=UPI001E4BC633|nr:tyrosine-type recombinase/integrase [uncultured Enterococcus sp.]
MVIKYFQQNDFEKVTLHAFRHIHTSLLFESRASIKEFQDRLGHKYIYNTMRIYAHFQQKK